MAHVRRVFFSALGATARMGGSRAVAGVREGLWGLLGGVLSEEEKSRLGVALYDASEEHRGEERYAWEERWFDRWVERGRSRVLVGAAGAGREVNFFVGRGCAVTALEPSGALRALCRERVPGTPVIEARYEDVAAGRVDVGGGYDAVLLGLGSLSHVLDGAVRAALVRALVRVCPRGPILVSVLSPPRAGAGARALRGGRAARIGRGIGAGMRVVRGLPEVESGEVVFGGLGFVKLFERGELRALGEGVGRTVVFEEGAPDGMELCAIVSGGEG